MRKKRGFLKVQVALLCPPFTGRSLGGCWLKKIILAEFEFFETIHVIIFNFLFKYKPTSTQLVYARLAGSLHFS